MYNEIYKLQGIGLTRPDATVLSFFKKHFEGSQLDIQMATRSRQGDISNFLRFSKYVEICRKENSSLKGRPINIYQLIKPYNDVVEEIARARTNILYSEIKKIKDLVK